MCRMTGSRVYCFRIWQGRTSGVRWSYCYACWLCSWYSDWKWGMLYTIVLCPAEWINLPRLLLIFSQSDYLIWNFAIISQIFTGEQCRSRSVGFFRSQLIWIYTVCKGRVYPGSAGHGLTRWIYIPAHILKTFESSSNENYFSVYVKSKGPGQLRMRAVWSVPSFSA